MRSRSLRLSLLAFGLFSCIGIGCDSNPDGPVAPVKAAPGATPVTATPGTMAPPKGGGIAPGGVAPTGPAD